MAYAQADRDKCRLLRETGKCDDEIADETGVPKSTIRTWASRGGWPRRNLLENLVGKRYGKLTAISEVGKNDRGEALYHCRCDCGNEKVATYGALRANGVRSCGCLIADTLKARRIDIAGKRFGKLVAVAAEEGSQRGSVLWRCECDCGREKLVKCGALRSGNTRSCGCLMLEAAHQRRVDLTGRRFGSLVVISATGENSPSGALWRCRCDCGNESLAPRDNLTGDHTQSCGCLRRLPNPRPTVDLSGQRFGKLTVLSWEKRDERGWNLWRCLCDCGKQTTVLRGNLRSGRTKSCGCLLSGTDEDLAGKRFGKLIVISKTRPSYRKCKSWQCRCDCGRDSVFLACKLKNGSKVSCHGCSPASRRGRSALNLVDERYGKLVVVSRAEGSSRKSALWHCRCDCGNQCVVPSRNLRQRRKKSCGCLLRLSTQKGDSNPNYRGGGCSDKEGYVMVKVEGKKLRQHRVVMSKHLGRSLLPTETVHHINGDRGDNRIENLEVWVRGHPSGIRRSDVLTQFSVSELMREIASRMPVSAPA